MKQFVSGDCFHGCQGCTLPTSTRHLEVGSSIQAKEHCNVELSGAAKFGSFQSRNEKVERGQVCDQRNKQQLPQMRPSKTTASTHGVVLAYTRRQNVSSESWTLQGVSHLQTNWRARRGDPHSICAAGEDGLSESDPRVSPRSSKVTTWKKTDSVRRCRVHHGARDAWQHPSPPLVGDRCIASDQRHEVS